MWMSTTWQDAAGNIRSALGIGVVSSPPLPQTQLNFILGLDAVNVELRELRLNAGLISGRGLHSSTFRLNWSAFYGIGGARRGREARVKGVFSACRVFLCVRHGSS